MKNKTKEIWILSYRTFSETCVSVKYVCLGWTLEIISTFHNLVALHEPCRVRQFQIWCPLFWCPFFEFYQRRSINRRSPTIKMVSPKLFVYSTVWTFVDFLLVPTVEGSCWGVCFFKQFCACAALYGLSCDRLVNR